jgi:uncharacterized protein DUF4870
MQIPSARDVTSDERILAAVAHGSIILVGWGIIATTVLWITQRQKSAFVAFHALQALLYQLLQTICIAIVIPLAALIFIGVIAAIALATASRSAGPDPALFILAQFAFIGSIFCGFGLYALLGIVGAVWMLLSRDFYYPLIGRRMKRFLSAEPPAATARVEGA